MSNEVLSELSRRGAEIVALKAALASSRQSEAAMRGALEKIGYELDFGKDAFGPTRRKIQAMVKAALVRRLMAAPAQVTEVPFLGDKEDSVARLTESQEGKS